MVQYVITPWRDRRELLEVRETLYQIASSQPDAKKRRRDAIDDKVTNGMREQKRHAVAKVAVWMQRGNCPHLVESTAILTSAVLNDLPGTEMYCVRAAYAAAFCRFVTGLLDSHQTKLRKLSMYSIAKTIGLPATYVELRHQATHEELPSLSKLRIATQKALKWIWDYYWVHLQNNEAATGSRCITEVRSVVEEADEDIRADMTYDLIRQWGGEKVVEALMEIQEATRDTQVLLRISQIQISIIDDNEDETQVPGTLKDLEAVKAELKVMEHELDSVDDTKNIPLPVLLNTQDKSKGWEMWEGPWIPKPIGVV